MARAPTRAQLKAQLRTIKEARKLIEKAVVLLIKSNQLTASRSATDALEVIDQVIEGCR